MDPGRANLANHEHNIRVTRRIICREHTRLIHTRGGWWWWWWHLTIYTIWMSFFVRRKSWKKSNAEKNCAKANLTADDVLQKNIAKKKYKKKSYCRHFPARSGPEQCNNQKSSFVVCTWPGSRKHKIKVSCLYFFPGQKVFIPKMCCPPRPPPPNKTE